MVAIATLWRFMYDPEDGLINALLSLVGITGPEWLLSTTWAMPASILMKAWKAVGYYTVLFLAGLQAIPVDLYDAAKVDGATMWQRARFLTLPLLSPTTLFVVVISVIGSFQDFDQVYVMTRGGPVNSTSAKEISTAIEDVLLNNTPAIDALTAAQERTAPELE